MPAIPSLPEPDGVPSVQGVPLHRVVVYGVTGAGKSVAAERLGRLLGLPYVAIDDLMWEPGWVMVGEEEKRRRIEEVCAGETPIDRSISSRNSVSSIEPRPIVRVDCVERPSFKRIS